MVRSVLSRTCSRLLKDNKNRFVITVAISISISMPREGLRGMIRDKENATLLNLLSTKLT